MNPFELIEYTSEEWADFFLGFYNELSSLYFTYDSLKICDITDNYFDAFLVRKYGLVSDDEWEALPKEEKEGRVSAMRERIDEIKSRGFSIFMDDIRRLSVYYRIPIPQKHLWKDGYVPFLNQGVFRVVTKGRGEGE
jgi:hypothetical protein